MYFGRATIRPGVILEVLGGGEIKASAPGLFMEDDKDSNPPVMPFWKLLGTAPNQFSSPIAGENIWVINTVDNSRELYWFRRDSNQDNNKEILDECGEESVEILCNKQGESGWASIYFSDGTGWVIKNDSSKIQIDKNGDILLDPSSDHGRLKLDSGVTMGTGAHQAALGDEVKSQLDAICNLLVELGPVAAANPMTANLTTTLAKASTILLSNQKVISNHVKLD